MIRKALLTATTLSMLLPSIPTATPLFDTLQIAPDTASAAQPKIDEGLVALHRNDLAAADAAFKAALALDPRAAGSYLGLAEVAGRLNKDVAVESWLRKGIAALPNNFMLLHTLGVWYAKKGRWSDAEKHLVEAVRVTPQSTEALTALGEVYLARSKTLTKAETSFRKALAVDTRLIPAQLGLARALAGLGQIKEAKSVLEGAASAAPSDPLPLLVSARLAASQGNSDEAIGYLQKTIAIAPAFLPAYLDKGDLYLARNDPDSAAAAYRAGAANAKDPVRALFRLGVALEAAQRWDEAERAYLEATERDPKLFGAYNNLAFMMAERKVNLDKALTWIEKAAAIAPLSATVRDTKGWIYRARGDLSRAAATIEEARKLDPKDAAVHYHLGLVYSELGRQTEAISAFQQALALHPGSRLAPRARDYLKQLGK